MFRLFPPSASWRLCAQLIFACIEEYRYTAIYPKIEGSGLESVSKSFLIFFKNTLTKRLKIGRMCKNGSGFRVKDFSITPISRKTICLLCITHPEYREFLPGRSATNGSGLVHWSGSSCCLPRLWEFAELSHLR